MFAQRLGFRAFVLYMIKGLLPGLLLLFVMLVLVGSKNLIVAKFFVGVPNADKIVLYIIGGLYVAAVLAIIIGVAAASLHYFGCRFTMDEYAFKLRRGIVSRDEVSIPYRQIQDVNVDQSILGRMIGIGKLIIITAGNEEHDRHGEETEVVFDIVDISIAKHLQRTLTERSSVQLVKNA